MTDPLYLIQLYPRTLHPRVGDQIEVVLVEPSGSEFFRIEIRLRSGGMLSCERVTATLDGALVRFPPLPIVGTASAVCTPPAPNSMAEAAYAFAKEDRCRMT